MTLLLLIVILAILILVHEAGHFVVARLAGMWVEEFGIGFPPRILAWRRGETEYSVNLFPVGGFVKIYGENPVESNNTPPTSHLKFGQHHKLKQAGVLVAGVTGNWLLAWVLLTIGLVIGLPLATGGLPAHLSLEQSRVIITSVLADSPAARAGLLPGDEIKFLTDGKNTLSQPTVELVQNFIGSGTRTIGVITPRGEFKVLPVSGLTKESIKPTIGITLDQVGLAKLALGPAIIWGAYLAGKLSVAVAVALWHFVVSIPAQGGAAFASITGPVGLLGLVGEAKSLGWVYLISLTAIISINLAVVNLIPVPALDGGRLVMLGIEAIWRRPLNEKLITRLNQVSFILLLLLLAVVTYQDIWRLVR